jgi:2-methylisocitrate lyase-like PEP mutase family enzyme
VRLASDVGLAGGSIEDATGNPDDPIYETGLAADRIRAAAEATRNRPFLLTARAENFLWGRPDLADTIARLQAFSEAGADVLYAPGLPDIEAIRSVCSAVDKPVNVVMGLQGTGYTMEDLSRAGVARVSVGGSFARAALGALMDAAREVKQKGTFNYAMSAIPDAVVSQYMDQGPVQKRT